jgi:hypothetical protein
VKKLHLSTLSIALEGIAPPKTEDAQTLLLVVSTLVAHVTSLEQRVAELEARVRPLDEARTLEARVTAAKARARAKREALG